MNTYSVKEIAAMLHTDPETVRRWIRVGKLKAEKATSKKEGLVVTEKMLSAFFENFPKYAGLAATSSAENLFDCGISLVASVISSLIAQGYENKKTLKNARINPQDLKSLIDNEIKLITGTINEKQNNISEIEKEITELQAKVKELYILRDKVDDSEFEK